MKRLILLVLVACQSSAPTRPDQGDISVPKMPPDSGGAASPSPPVDSIAVVKASGSSHGWHFEEEQLQPKYVTNDKLAAELHAAAKSGNLALAIVDEKIEECSSAGGSHVLLKTDLGLVHFGGHGLNLQVGPLKGETVVVALEKLAAPESIEKKAFCVPARTIFARAKVVLVVAQARDGERMIADLAK